MHPEERKIRLADVLKQQDDNPFKPNTWDSAKLHNSTISQMSTASLIEQQYKKRESLTKFRETYIKLRTDNIALDHRTAIELSKMIYQEADTITYDDL